MNRYTACMAILILGGSVFAIFFATNRGKSPTPITERIYADADGFPNSKFMPTVEEFLLVENEQTRIQTDVGSGMSDLTFVIGMPMRLNEHPDNEVMLICATNLGAVHRMINGKQRTIVRAQRLQMQQQSGVQSVWVIIR